jgi:hypothetical protein
MRRRASARATQTAVTAAASPSEQGCDCGLAGDRGVNAYVPA